jgi:hypothetical protein
MFSLATGPCMDPKTWAEGEAMQEGISVGQRIFPRGPGYGLGQVGGHFIGQRPLEIHITIYNSSPVRRTPSPPSLFVGVGAAGRPQARARMAGRAA